MCLVQNVLIDLFVENMYFFNSIYVGFPLQVFFVSWYKNIQQIFFSSFEV